MYLKKTICSLMSVGILAGCLCCPASAESVEKILKEKSLVEVQEIMSLISTSGFNEFASAEKLKLSAKPHSVGDNHHLDSVMFWCLCILAYKNRLPEEHIENIVKHRNWVEIKRDNTVFKYFKKEIIGKLKESFGVTTVTRDELNKIYSVIMSKPLELRVRAGRDVTYTHTVPRGLQLMDKKIKKRPMWKSKKREARNNWRIALVRSSWDGADDVLSTDEYIGD